MKKLFYLAFIAVVALSFGCAITDYPVITDNEDDSGNFVVNTNGQASLLPTGQAITIGPDYNSEIHSTVDQAGNGDQNITSYSNLQTPGNVHFMAYTYCNIDQDGCWTTKSPNPAIGDASIFDYTSNANCDGWESLFFVISFGARTGECGRTGTVPMWQANSLTAIGTAMSDLRPWNAHGYDGYLFHMNNGNVSGTFTSVATGDRYAAVIPSTVVFLTQSGDAIIELNPSMSGFLHQVRALYRAHPEGMELDLNGPAGLSMNIWLSATDNVLRSTPW
jgi:hypothetical protein